MSIRGEDKHRRRENMLILLLSSTPGHIWDKNLFQQNVLAPNLYRRINDDLSLVPLPYRVTRNMLMSPGEFESLEFYRIRPDGADTGKTKRLVYILIGLTIRNLFNSIEIIGGKTS